jgi:hypothetical protein
MSLIVLADISTPLSRHIHFYLNGTVKDMLPIMVHCNARGQPLSATLGHAG